MKPERAIHDLATIRQRLQLVDARASFRCFSMFASSFVFLIAGLWQPDAGSSSVGFVGYWTLIGAICCAGIATEVWLRSISIESRITMEWSRRLVRAMLPALATGGLVTCALLGEAQFATLLPGIWAVLAGLAIASCYQILPASCQLPALWLIVGGALALRFNEWAMTHLSLTMILLFGVGQLILACCLFAGGRQDGE